MTSNAPATPPAARGYYGDSFAQMLGDSFGGQRIRVSADLGRLYGYSNAINFPTPANPNSPQPLTLQNAGTLAVLTASPPPTVLYNLSGGGKVGTVSQSANVPVGFTTAQSLAQVNQQLANNSLARVAIADNPAYRAAVDRAFLNQFGNRGTTTFNPQASFAQQQPAVVTTYPPVTVYVQNPNTESPEPVTTQRPPTVTNSFAVLYAYDRTFATDLAGVPLPGSGGAVGPTKISDGNSPLPRDRVIFDFDYFDQTRLSIQGADVSRFSPGFEKTFFDGQASIEVRLPFASTIGNNLNEDGSLTSNKVLLGDLHFTLKAILYGNDFATVSSGLGLALPTAPDVKIVDANGSDFVKFRDQTVTLSPFLALYLTPNDRLFAQAWLTFDFDTSGGSVLANVGGGGLQNIGRIYDQTVMSIDTQIGYWIWKADNSEARLKGLAPFLELHYNTSLTKQSSIDYANPANPYQSFAIGGGGDHFDELNLSAGFNAAFRDNLVVQVGGVFPLKSGENGRSFDYQIGVRLNWLFGAAAKDGKFRPNNF